MRWLDDLTDSMNMSLSKLWEMVTIEKPGAATVHRHKELDMTGET